MQLTKGPTQDVKGQRGASEAGHQGTHFPLSPAPQHKILMTALTQPLRFHGHHRCHGKSSSLTLCHPAQPWGHCECLSASGSRSRTILLCSQTHSKWRENEGEMPPLWCLTALIPSPAPGQGGAGLQLLGNWLGGWDICSYALMLPCSREVWSIDVSVSRLIYLLIEELSRISQWESLEGKEKKF